MSAITLKMTESAYELSKQVYLSKMSRAKALDKLESEEGMNRGSASDYIVNFHKMMEGEQYSRTFNTEATDYILSKIYLDFGEAKYNKAINAVHKHVAYYEGLGRSRLNSIKIVLEKHVSKISDLNPAVYPDELENSQDIFEGAKQTVTVNYYERNQEARGICISHHGCSCIICKFDFEKVFGELGKGFIHVHHIVPISKIGKEYAIDPVKDLRPVCPNCHAMLHRVNPPISIEDLQHRT